MAGEAIDVRYINAGRVRGLSAYELAVKHGVFTGTEQEFAEAQRVDDSKIQAVDKKVDKLAEDVNKSLGELEEDVNQNITTKLDEIDGKIKALEERANIEIEDQFIAVNSDIDDMKNQIADLMYSPIQINSFNSNVNVVEKGEAIKNILLNWTLSKDPVTQTIDINPIIDRIPPITASDRGAIISGKDIVKDTTFTLTVTDERGTTATKTVSITFLNGVYYGAHTNADGLTSEQIIGTLTKNLQSSKDTTFTVNAGSSEYIYFCMPSRFDAPRFIVGGFEGGFDKVSTIYIKNASGYSDSYDIYRSTNMGLGNTTVSVL